MITLWTACEGFEKSNQLRHFGVGQLKRLQNSFAIGVQPLLVDVIVVSYNGFEIRKATVVHVGRRFGDASQAWRPECTKVTVFFADGLNWPCVAFLRVIAPVPKLGIWAIQ